MPVQVTTSDYMLAAGQTLSAVDEAAVSITVAPGAFADVTIAGQVQVSATAEHLGPNIVSSELDAIASNFTQVFDGGQVVILSGAEVSIDTEGSRHTTSGVNDMAGQEVENFGTVHVVADVRAVGINATAQSTPGGPIQFVNAGTIDVTSNGGDALGGEVQGQGAQNTGVIHVVGLTSAVGIHAQAITSFDNSGEIDAQLQPGAGNVQSVGLEISAGLVAHPSVTNSGHIEADIALKLATQSFFDGASASVTNSGQLVGEVDIAGLPTTLTNTGSITGAINLGTGNDVYDGRLGVEAGLLQGGQGDDTLTGGNGFDNLQGNQGDDSVSGGAGDDVVVGGKDNDVQHGDDGDDVVWGNLGDDTLDGGNGADQVRGGQGDDVISGGNGNDFISGDRGNDTETGGAGADIFHGSQDAGIDKVMDFSQAEGDRVQLDPGTTYTVSQVGADTVIDMGGGNQMILVGVNFSTLKDGWIFEA